MKVELYKVLSSFLALHNVSVDEFVPPYKISNIDQTVRNMLLLESDLDIVVQHLSSGMDKETMYIVRDIFDIYYAAIMLEDGSVLAIGPYLLSGRHFKEQDYLEKGFDGDEIKLIKNHLLTIPHIHEEIILYHVSAILAAALSKERIPVRYIQETRAKGKKHSKFSLVQSESYTAKAIDKLEERYSIENRILEAVRLGNVNGARKAMGRMVQRDFIRRYTPLQTSKKSLIVMNTLFRKSIEQAGVHPYYVDEISYRFFQKIDFIRNRKEQAKLLDEMVVEYCSYVKRYAAEKHSHIVQNALNYINANIFTQISLKDIAEKLNISASHLARVFRRETGNTVMEYINIARIKSAADRLHQSERSVTEIAAECGFSDTNYFSRMFRKYMGCSPTEYRKQR